MHDRDPPLRRAGDVEGAGDPHLCAPQVGGSESFRIDQHAAVRVGDPCVLAPRIPQPPQRLDELLGAVVARLVVGVRVPAVVARGARFGSGDEVDPGPTAREHVQRCQRACRRIGIGIGGVDRRDQTDPGGDSGEEVHGAHGVDASQQIRVAELQIGSRRQPVAEEEVVQPCVLPFPRDVPQDVGIRRGVTMRTGVPPARGIRAQGAHHGADEKGFGHPVTLGAHPSRCHGVDAGGHGM